MYCACRSRNTKGTSDHLHEVMTGAGDTIRFGFHAQYITLSQTIRDILLLGVSDLEDREGLILITATSNEPRLAVLLFGHVQWPLLYDIPFVCLLLFIINALLALNRFNLRSFSSCP